MTLLLYREVGSEAEGVVSGKLSARHQRLPSGFFATSAELFEHSRVTPLEVGVAWNTISTNRDWRGGRLYPKVGRDLIVPLPIHTINLLQLLYYIIASQHLAVLVDPASKRGTNPWYPYEE